MGGSTRPQEFVRELFNGSDEVIGSHPEGLREEAYVSIVHDVVAILEACHRTTSQSDALSESLLTEPPLKADSLDDETGASILLDNLVMRCFATFLERLRNQWAPHMRMRAPFYDTLYE